VRLIAEFGLRAHAVEGVEAAIATIAGRRVPGFSMCLINHRTPGVNGIEEVRRVRSALKAHCGITKPPLILITSYGAQDAIRDTGDQIDGLLARPLTRRVLHSELARCLGIAFDEPLEHDRRSNVAQDWSRFRDLDILLVDDVELNQEVISELLAEVGLKVRTAANGAEALEEAGRRLPDLILMDCQMPVMDGFTATRRLRDNPAACATPIIALTANAMIEDRERCIAAGMNGYVSKPVDMKRLHEEMRRCVPVPGARPADLPLNTGQSASAPELLRLPGIDVAKGLAHVGGRMPFFLKILKKFRDNQGRNFAFQFVESQSADDWETRMRMAHTLKGIAQTIGAMNLGEAAVGLLKATEARDEQRCAELLDEVLDRLGVVTKGLANIDEMMES
jgi:CheY-like chemotaxis protein/HPt (histidine-containing phosphotransfer) domain-containing protein